MGISLKDIDIVKLQNTDIDEVRVNSVKVWEKISIFTLTVNTDAHVASISVKVDGVEVAPESAGIYKITAGKTAVITATASTYYHITSTNPQSVVMDGDKSVSCTSEVNSTTLSVSSSDSNVNNLIVTRQASPTGASIEELGRSKSANYTVYEGDQIKIQITTNQYYHAKRDAGSTGGEYSWADNQGYNTEASETFTVDAGMITGGVVKMYSAVDNGYCYNLSSKSISGSQIIVNGYARCDCNVTIDVMTYYGTTFPFPRRFWDGSKDISAGTAGFDISFTSGTNQGWDDEWDNFIFSPINAGAGVYRTYITSTGLI